MISQWKANPTAYLDRPESSRPPTVSMEMFPPTHEIGEREFLNTLRKLRELAPQFVSVTSGAGGEGNRRNLETIITARQKFDLPYAAHLTCIGKSGDQVHQEVDRIRRAGVRHLVALRGDASESDVHRESGLGSALEMVRAIRSRKDAEDYRISVAAYPEGHPDARNQKEEMEYLKQKVNAGADDIITQFFFDSEVFAEFMDRIRSAGIDIPVLPGILPIVNFDRTVTFAEKCQTKIPKWYHVMYRDLSDSGSLHKEISISIAVEQCRQLMALGIKDLHFYTLNRFELTLAICKELGMPSVRPDSQSGLMRNLAVSK